MKWLAAVMVLLCLAGIGRGGEKDIWSGIISKGGDVDFGGSLVSMPHTTTDADLGELCELCNLTTLWIDKTKITDRGLRTVATVRCLLALSLEGSDITDLGLIHLESMSKLNHLNLHDCPDITDAGVARLQKALPQCKIER